MSGSDLAIYPLSRRQRIVAPAAQIFGLRSDPETRLREFLERLHGPTTTSVALCRKHPDGRWHQDILPADELLASALLCIGETQCYVGLHPVEFEAARRTQEELEALNAFFLDLDTYRIDPSKFSQLSIALNAAQKDDPEPLAEALLKHCNDKAIPQPSFVMFSGRGIQLIWLFNTIKIPETGQERHRLIGDWCAIEQGLLTVFEPFHSDGKAALLTQVVRLPETVNAESGFRARVVWARPGRYSFAEFETFADPEALRHNRRAARGNSSRRARPLPPRMRVVLQTRFEIEDFVRRSYPGGLTEGCGKRNAIVHTYARACRFSASPASWRSVAIDWAQQSTDLSTGEIATIIASVARSTKGFSRRNAAQALGVTAELADAYSYVRLRPTPLAANQRRARSTQLRRERLREQGIKPRLPTVVPAIAKAAKISLATLYRHTTSEQRRQASELWRAGQLDQALSVIGMEKAAKSVRGTENDLSKLNGSSASLSLIRPDLPPSGPVKFPSLAKYLGLSARTLRRRPQEVVTHAERILRETGRLPNHLQRKLSRQKAGRPSRQPSSSPTSSISCLTPVRTVKPENVEEEGRAPL